MLGFLGWYYASSGVILAFCSGGMALVYRVLYPAFWGCGCECATCVLICVAGDGSVVLVLWSLGGLFMDGCSPLFGLLFWLLFGVLGFVCWVVAGWWLF